MSNRYGGYDRGGRGGYNRPSGRYDSRGPSHSQGGQGGFGGPPKRQSGLFSLIFELYFYSILKIISN